MRPLWQHPHDADGCPLSLADSQLEEGTMGGGKAGIHAG
jgi:hypothetical protein